MPDEPKMLLDGLVFPEGPRWHNGKLWFSDMRGYRVMTVDVSGASAVVADLPNMPSGLGWLPDGRLVAVSMHDRQLLMLGEHGMETYADLSGVATGDCNDMVIDGRGRAYVGNFGAEIDGARQPANIALVENGAVRVVAEGLMFPNGAVITPDGGTFIVAETLANRLSAFDIAGDGSLSNRRVFAELGAATPDGVCLDAEGAVWVSSFFTNEFLRVKEGGEVRDRIEVPGKMAIACALGGASRTTLFLLTATGTLEDMYASRTRGFIETVEVAVPGAGWP
ncbi:MAG: SMP-30/gluconolactonase/LRE family protein [Tepidiformaceae bacterium]